MPFLGALRSKLKKNYYHILNQPLRIFKTLNLGRKLSYLSIFGLEFGKTIVMPEASTLEFIQNDFLTIIVKGLLFPKVQVRVRFIKYAINFGIISSLCSLYSVGYNLLMGLDILIIVLFFIYRTITPLT